MLKLWLGGKCQQCGSTVALEFHIQSNRKNGKDHHGLGPAGRIAFYERAARMGELRLLCIDCHRGLTVLRPANLTNNSANPYQSARKRGNHCE